MEPLGYTATGRWPWEANGAVIDLRVQFPVTVGAVVTTGMLLAGDSVQQWKHGKRKRCYPFCYNNDIDCVCPWVPDALLGTFSMLLDFTHVAAWFHGK